MSPRSHARGRVAARLVLVAVGVLMLLSAAAPLQAASDRDRDGLDDAVERTTSKTNPRKRDTDGDGLTDGFEVRWGVSDPRKRDTDGDGLIDALEDADGDQLSAQGEQRFGTDPGARDTDGDGIRDGADDANENGVRDALEQDRIKVPQRLKSAVRASPNDFVNDQNGCHTDIASDHLYRCIYGDTTGRVDIAIFGDSHGLQWLPAIDKAGEKRGWRVTSFTKSACPSVAVTMQEPRFRMSSCLRWRKTARAWLKAHPQDLVVIANSGRYTLVDRNNEPLRDEARQKRWQQGLASTIKALPAKTKVVVLADTPRFLRDPHRCLLAPGRLVSDCQTRRAAAIIERHDEVEREISAELGAHFADLNDVVCPYDPCALLAGNTAIWRDKGHLTETFARQLAPSVQRAIRAALRRKSPGLTEESAPMGLTATTVAVAVHDDFFEPDTIEVESDVEFELIFTNVGKKRHRLSFLTADGGLAVDGGGVQTVLGRGTSSDVIMPGLEPGAYTLNSDALPDAMSGKLVVRKAPLPSDAPAATLLDVATLLAIHGSGS